MCFSQSDVKPVEIGSFCYIDSLSKKLVFNETCTVIKKDKFINVAFSKNKKKKSIKC